ncbi:glycosyltransferase [bacterium]|nr:glycosyltransferase [bacterium]
MTHIDIILLAAYFAVLLPLAGFGAHRLWMLIALRHVTHRTPPDASAEEELPTITIQLPLYNEPAVAARLIDAVCKFDYPRDQFDVQVLDDSTDETTTAAAERVDSWTRRGISISHLRRADREGYKAGALAWGLQQSDAELVAVFDADFIPQPDFLRRLVPEFADDRVGMVQARWGHLNRDYSVLTRAQALFLDAHFRIEHAVRAATGRYFNFNGTAGIWRRAAIDDAGGWQGDTLTEDLDLSYRAQLHGWKFVYRDDVEAPAELPADLRAFRSQQHRWAKGSMETSRKLLPTILRAPIAWPLKLEAAIHLLGNVANLLLLVLALLLFRVFLLRELNNLALLLWTDLLIFLPATVIFAAYFARAARMNGTSWLRAIGLSLAAMAIGIGMSLNNACAVIHGLTGRRTPFVRTPKRGMIAQGTTWKEVGTESKITRRHIDFRDILPWLEFALGAHFIILIATATYYTVPQALPFAALFAAGYFTIAGISFGQSANRFFQSRRARRAIAALPADG